MPSFPIFGQMLIKAHPPGGGAFGQNIYHCEIIAVYHNVQNEKKHMSKSRDIEFGHKNNLETGPKWAQFGPNYFFRML